MARVSLTFDIDDSKLEKLIPSAAIYAQIQTAKGVVEIVDRDPRDEQFAKDAEGTNARLLVESKSSTEGKSVVYFNGAKNPIISQTRTNDAFMMLSAGIFYNIRTEVLYVDTSVFPYNISVILPRS